jgi:pantetheine-phosphate adenylyltransferase
MIYVLAGSFDPFTLGHKDIVSRFSNFGEVIVLISNNPDKKYLFDLEQRKHIIELTCPNVKIEELRSNMATISYVKSINGTLIRGLRNNTDFDYEQNMYLVNKTINDVETIYLMSNPKYLRCKSSNVRELLRLKLDVSEYMDKNAINYVREI